MHRDPRSSRSCRIAVGVMLLLAAPTTTALAQDICGEWAQVDPPAGATRAVVDVEARSTTDAFAFAIPLGLVRWDGTAWNQFPVPIEDLNEWPQVWITDFGLVGPDHIFLAGLGNTGPFSNDQLLMFYDGSSWDHASVTLEPNIQGAPRNGAASAVVGAAPDDVWILGNASGTGDGVGGNLLLTVHWDGSTLTEFLTPGPNNRQNNVNDGVAIASDDVWAVGDYNNTNNPDGRFRGLTYHWDGSTWSHIPNPSEQIVDCHLETVTAIASDDVWAAGGHLATPFFMHWDGSAWSVVPSPATTGSIYQIAAIASDDVWAVDSAAQVPIVGKFYHWDGVEWSVVMPPEIPGVDQVERHGGLAAVGPCDVWAVGSTHVAQGTSPLIERLQPGGVTGVPTSATSTGVPVALLGVAPNPLHQSTEIHIELPNGDARRAQIHDVQGRTIRTLFDHPLSGSLVSWDGRDDAGTPVPRGVYFLRVESTAGTALTQKLTVVR